MSVYHEQIGQGRDVVLVHGWGAHGGIWQPLSDQLADRFRVHLVDLPGHGFSAPLVEFNLETIAAAVAESLVNQIDFPAILIGWSLGALVSLRLASDHAEWFSDLIWIAGTPCFCARPDWSVGMPAQTLDSFAAGLDRDVHKTLTRFVSLNGGAEDKRDFVRGMQNILSTRRQPALQALRQGIGILRHANERARLIDLPQPLMLIQGDSDQLVSAQTVTAIQALRPARALPITGAGHAPFLKHAAEIAEVLGEFV